MTAARRVSLHLEEPDVRDLEYLRRCQNATTLSGALNGIIAIAPTPSLVDMGVAGGIAVSLSFTEESLERLAELQEEFGVNRSAVARGIIRAASRGAS